MSDQSNAIGGADQPSARRSIIFTDGTDAIGEVVPAADGPSPIEGRLRKAPLRVPEGYGECTGFTLFGRRIRSLLYSTDVAVIRNSNADAIFAVYPFTAQPAITQALLTVAEAPLFVGVGGGTTTGRRAAKLAAVSEMQGAAGVVLNSPATPDMVAQVVSTVDIPVVASITRFDEVTRQKVEAGARIINVAAGRNTAAVIRELREAYPNLPILATGGKTPEVTGATVEAGANALIWAPPSITELQRDMMVRYREREAVEAVGPEDAGVAAGVGAAEAEPAVSPMPDITDMPVADVPAGVVDTVPPEAEAAVPAGKPFVSPFKSRLPRLPFLGRHGR